VFQKPAISSLVEKLSDSDTDSVQTVLILFTCGVKRPISFKVLQQEKESLILGTLAKVGGSAFLRH